MTTRMHLLELLPLVESHGHKIPREIKIINLKIDLVIGLTMVIDLILDPSQIIPTNLLGTTNLT